MALFVRAEGTEPPPFRDRFVERIGRTIGGFFRHRVVAAPAAAVDPNPQRVELVRIEPKSKMFPHRSNPVFSL